MLEAHLPVMANPSRYCPCCQLSHPSRLLLQLACQPVLSLPRSQLRFFTLAETADTLPTPFSPCTHARPLSVPRSPPLRYRHLTWRSRVSTSARKCALVPRQKLHVLSTICMARFAANIKPPTICTALRTVSLLLPHTGGLYSCYTLPIIFCTVCLWLFAPEPFCHTTHHCTPIPFPALPLC